MVVDPVTMPISENTLSEALGIKEKHNISGFQLLENNQKLVGILTHLETLDQNQNQRKELNLL